MVSSVPSRLGEHPGEATLLHGKVVKARSATSKIHTSGLWIDKLANQELLSSLRPPSAKTSTQHNNQTHTRSETSGASGGLADCLAGPNRMRGRGLAKPGRDNGQAVPQQRNT